MTTHFISDPHFGHKWILAYEPGRIVGLGIQDHPDVQLFQLRLKCDPERKLGMTSEAAKKAVKVMDVALIARWNATIQPDDTVVCLGDVSFGLFDAQQLNGYKILILGNHDSSTGTMLERGWDEVYTADEFHQAHHGFGYGDKQITISHEPRSLEWMDEHGFDINVHGHLHSRPLELPSTRHHCVSLEAAGMDFAPITEERLMDLLGVE